MDDAVRRRLEAVFDRVVPDDGWPSSSQAGVADFVSGLADDPVGRRLHDDVLEVLGRLAQMGGDDELDDAIGALDTPAHELLVRVGAMAYYGDRHGAGARMVGFRAEGSRDPGAPVVEPAIAPTSFRQIADDYDVVVIGAGAGGGVSAQVVAEAGARVLVVDRGALLPTAEITRDHLRNHRSNVLGHNTGPGEGNPRVHVGTSGRERVVEHSHEVRWHNNAMTVGGGTRVYQGMAWRFAPDDFAMASRYGVPDDSSLADWPIAYDDLAPHYDWVEWEIGVCGDASGHRAAGPRRRGYPMPPLPPNREAAVLGAGATELGLATGPVPLLLNSVPFQGRPQCVRCGECVGFACPVGAKNGTYDTALPRALATRSASLVAGCRAVALTTDAAGTVDGVELLDESTAARRRVRAGHVVLAAGAIETARLLLASRSAAHPDGLGNGADQVGRHLQGHGFVSAFGRFDEEVIDPDGPGVSIATLDFLHGNEGVIGGGVIANEIVKLPIVHWAWALPPDAPRWGLGGKAAMRDTYRTTSHLFAQVQEIPQADNRVTLATTVDARGEPVARLSGRAHVETMATAEYLSARAAEWLEASGARRVWIDPMPTGLLAGQHQAGTCRMGTDPATSVVDPDGRVHGHGNLWVADASVHVTNGGVNPALTIMALAHRTAGHVAAH